MRSKSRLTSSALRRGVPLKTMCSKKCVTPDSSGASSREPGRTKKPSATERAEGLVSPMICRPLDSFWLWKGMLWPPLRRRAGLADAFWDRERLGPKRHDAEVARRVAAQMADDGLGRQR